MRFQSWLREDIAYRREAFARGLQAVGYKEVSAIREPSPSDVFVCWNRYGRFDAEAKRFEAAGARVVVAENGLLGKDWRGGEWYSLALEHVAVAGGAFPEGDSKRWDACDVRLEPWRGELGETVILGQRGIGEPGIAAPWRWAERTQTEYRGRIRPHPGTDRSCTSLEHDLRNACAVLTWASAAALHALRWGIPVFHEHPSFIGAPAASPLSGYGARQPKRDDAARIAMFRRLAWANWRLDEIESGAAFAHLLQRA